MKNTLSILLFLSIFISSCYNEDDYKLSKLNTNFVDLVFEYDTILADGVSRIKIEFRVPINAKNDIPVVKFTTTNGIFENGEKKIEIQPAFIVEKDNDIKVATTFLTASQKIEDAVIDAKIGDISKQKTLRFTRAYPEKIETIIPSLSIVYGFQTFPIATKISRKTGNPSCATQADIVAIDSLGTEIGYFLNKNNTIDCSGSMVNNFSLGNDTCNYCSKVYFISRTTFADGLENNDTSSMFIIK